LQLPKKYQVCLYRFSNEPDKLKYHLSYIKSMNNLIFICGCGHSGTTLLWAMLSAHSRIYGIPYETGVFLNSAINNGQSLTATRRAIVSCYLRMFGKRAKKGFSSFVRNGYLSYARTDFSIITFFKNYLELAGKNNKDIICEKTPRHVLRIDRIKKIFPESCIVALVRNGLDVTASIKERRGDFDKAMNRWIHDNLALLEFQKKFPLHIVKYENLIINPEHELREICRYCDIEYEENMMSYQNSPLDSMWKLELRREQVCQPLIDRRGRWRGALTSSEVTKFRGNAGDLMKIFDYTFD